MSDEVPNQPEHGDPEILPKGIITRPSGERMPFSTSGELLPDGPKLPADFLDASDVADFNWTRKRGNEWTDSTFRAEILTYISTFIAAHTWARTWEIVERVFTPSRPGRLRFPILIFRFTDDTDVLHEVAQEFPDDERTGSALTDRLLQVTLSLEASHP